MILAKSLIITTIQRALFSKIVPCQKNKKPAIFLAIFILVTVSLETRAKTAL